jgi:hypothetical protein
MEQLLEDYQRRLKRIKIKLEADEFKTLPDNIPLLLKLLKHNRLTTKASCYRTTVSELEREIRIQKEEIKSETSFGK